MKKILAFSSIRSDYDIMSPLYVLLNGDDSVDFKIIASGAHLSRRYGYSINQIRKDGFEILLELETMLDSDTALARLKSAGILLQNSLETIKKYSPDLMIYAGDREDILVYAMIGGYLGVPTVHFFSGDHVEDGYIDNPVRHATSKLSTVHFVSLKEHEKRLIRMGEHPKRIHVTGNISLDKFLSFELMPKSKLQKYFNLSFELNDFALLIFHPVTAEIEHAGKYFENILKGLKSIHMTTFVSYPNVDPGNHNILNVIDKYSKNSNFIFYKNLERDVFMSIYKQSRFIIGNSSSGICEAASLKIPAINIGLRQTGRYADGNVLFCGTTVGEIKKTIQTALSGTFQEKLKGIKNSYGDGKSAIKAYELIKSIDFKSLVPKIEDPLKIN